MKTAYLYIRVSTDEQKRRGYSLPEQEDRLLKYCYFNNIEVKGIFREDYSAKTFNRPEWKKLITVIKSRSSKDDKSILFIKWDRFSRNIENAYETIGMLRKHKTTAMAIDQPIDFSVPESTVMLAVYLSVPEAENSRRAMNTANGIRRAKLMGRYPGKAPMGFMNLTTVNGKKVIVPKQPEADMIKWVFHQLAKNIYRLEAIRKMADEKGLKCSRSYFHKFIRNPAYCGLIPIKHSSQEQQIVQGIHDPLISETLFHEVQNIISTKRRTIRKTDNLKATFYLTGFLTCPLCSRKLLGSFSQGRQKRYPYYHCRGKCKTRIRASLLNDSYEQELQKLVLSDKAVDLFNCVLEDWNTSTQKTEYLQERRQVEKKLKEQELFFSQARKLFVSSVLNLDDYKEIKTEYHINSKSLRGELEDINVKLMNIDKQRQQVGQPLVNILHGFSEMDSTDKKHLVTLIPPLKVDCHTKTVTLEISRTLSRILLPKYSNI